MASSQAKLLRGGSFVQPNTAAAPAAILQNDELHAEDLHALTRTSTIMLRPTIILWRQALSEVAQDLAQETKKPANQIASAPPATIRVIDFKPPPPVNFKGIHRVDGTLNFQWQDRDAVVGGVYQPKVVVAGTSSTTSAATSSSEGGEGGKNSSFSQASNKSEDGKDDDGSEVVDYSSNQRKLWQAHELAKKDRVAWELLRQHWRDVGKRNKQELLAQQQQQQPTSTLGARSGVFLQQPKPGAIRQREETASQQEKRENNSAAVVVSSSAGDSATSSNQNRSNNNTSSAPEDDLETILRRAQEVLGL